GSGPFQFWIGVCSGPERSQHSAGRAVQISRQRSDAVRRGRRTSDRQRPRHAGIPPDPGYDLPLLILIHCGALTGNPAAESGGVEESLTGSTGLTPLILLSRTP